MASGKKYMLATECSKPAATNALMGNTTAITLSVTLRPASVIHTAMQTSTLQSTPRKNAVQNGSAALAFAISRYVPAIGSASPERTTNAARPAAPTKLAAQTTVQFFSTSRVVSARCAQAMASRLLPVKSSAPATTTSTSPSENTSPPSTREAAKPSVGSLATIT